MKAEARRGCLDFAQCAGWENREAPAQWAPDDNLLESTMFLRIDRCSRLRRIAPPSAMAGGWLRFGVAARPNKHGPPRFFADVRSTAPRRGFHSFPGEEEP
jgi:hypothetical protein